jgi:FAD/FMN-containing dehydrogenase
VTLDADLGDAIGERYVLVDPLMTASYETDWTRRFAGHARCVVRPADARDVGSVLQLCSRHGVAVVTQGGNTGLVGGGVPSGGEVVLSTSRMGDIGPVDVVARQVTVGAGVTLTALQQAVRPLGLDFGVDFAARDSATIGGLVSTNAGGARVLRYGTMRQQVVGLEAVLADGSPLSRLEALPKENTGYDLVGLLTGSEGTLAVITAVRVRLWPLLAHRTVALLALETTSAALDALAELKLRLGSLEAAELFLADGLALVRDHTGLPAPMAGEHAAYLLVECAARVDPRDAMLEALEEVSALTPGLVDIVVGEDARSRRGLWRYREAHTESINANGVPVKLDVAIPHGQLERALQELPGVAAQAAPGARTIIFGHLNEGNLHVNVLGASDHHGVSEAVLRYVASLHGSISAEHGIGRAKTQWLGLSRSATEIAAMRSIKTALDPGQLLNPGVIFPD